MLYRALGKTLSCIIIAAGAAALPLMPAHAVDMQSRESRMLEQMNHELGRLRQDMTILQKEFYSQDNSILKPRRVGNTSSQAEVRLVEMEEQLRDVNGRIEEAQHQVRQMQSRLEQFMKDLDFRLKALERVSTVQEPGMVRSFVQTGPAKAVDPNAPVDLLKPAGEQPPQQALKDENKENADQLAFAEAKTLLTQAQYDKALRAFKAFIEAYPESKQLPEAHYWSGEVYNIREDYEKAAIAFLKAYQSDTKGGKAGESLVRLGGVLGNMSKKQEACTTFSKAEKEFPKDAALKEQLKKERDRLGCS